MHAFLDWCLLDPLANHSIENPLIVSSFPTFPGGLGSSLDSSVLVLAGAALARIHLWPNQFYAVLALSVALIHMYPALQGGVPPGCPGRVEGTLWLMKTGEGLWRMHSSPFCCMMDFWSEWFLLISLKKFKQPSNWMCFLQAVWDRCLIEVLYLPTLSLFAPSVAILGLYFPLKPNVLALLHAFALGKPGQMTGGGVGLEGNTSITWRWTVWRPDLAL